MLNGKITRVKGGPFLEKIGSFHFMPIISEPFFIGDDFKTEPITEIIDEEIFMCDDVTYVWTITNGDF